jgi:hypothetical protein
MRPPARTIVVMLVCLVAAAASRWVGAPGPTAGALTRHDTVEISDAATAATFRFAPSVTPPDRAWILAAVAGARPEARQLIARVDGLVTITTEGRSATTTATGADMMGEMRTEPNGFAVWLNAARLDSDRAIDRPTVVLHELGHVVDTALVPADLDSRLDAAIPQAATCGDAGDPVGACAPPEERFADTFAKWALGGAVSAVGSGYGIPTPPSLEDWGRPLGELAAGVPAS